MAWFFAAFLLISWAVLVAFASTRRRAAELRGTRRGVLGSFIGHGERTLGLPVGGLRRGR
jgi:hypothetical protein